MGRGKTLHGFGCAIIDLHLATVLKDRAAGEDDMVAETFESNFQFQYWLFCHRYP
jgi:hypothetical protein